MCWRGPDLKLYRVTPKLPDNEGAFTFLATSDWKFGENLDKLLKRDDLTLKDICLRPATKDEYIFYFGEKYEENK